MRTARVTGWGFGTVAAALAVTWAVGGSGLQGGGITVVGANPATVPVVASGYAPTAASASSVAKGDAATLTSSDEGNGASRGRERGGGSTATAAMSMGAIAPGGAASTAATTPAAGAGAGGACAAGALRLQVIALAPAGVAAGSADSFGAANLRRYAPGIATRTEQLTLSFTNESRLSCTLRGYPSVDFLRGGIQGPLSAPDTFAGSPSVADLDLRPGDTATAEITFIANSRSNPHGSRCEQVVAVRVYAPGSTEALSSGVRDTSGHRLPSFYVCGHKVVVQAVQHG